VPENRLANLLTREASTASWREEPKKNQQGRQGKLGLETGLQDGQDDSVPN